MVEIVSVIIQPVNELGRLLECAADSLHELPLIDTEHREESVDVRERRLTNTRGLDTRRLNQTYVSYVPPVAIEDGIEMRGRHPAGRAATYNQYFSGSHLAFIGSELPRTFDGVL